MTLEIMFVVDCSDCIVFYSHSVLLSCTLLKYSTHIHAPIHPSIFHMYTCTRAYSLLYVFVYVYVHVYMYVYITQTYARHTRAGAARLLCFEAAGREVGEAVG